MINRTASVSIYIQFIRCNAMYLLSAVEHFYMRTEVNSNRFEISNRFENLFHLHGDFTVATRK